MRRTNYISSIILFISTITFGTASSQYVSIDSLRKIIKNAKDDTARIDAMNWMSFRFFQQFADDSSKLLAKEALALSKKNNYKSGEGFAYINFGNLKSMESYPLQFRDYTLQALKVFEEAEDKAFMGIAYSNLAIFYNGQGNYPEALVHLFKALKLQTESGHKFGLAHCYLIFGGCYSAQGDFKEAYRNLLLSTNLFRQLGEKHLLSTCYTFTGDVLLALGKYQEALQTYHAARDVNQELGNYEWIKSTFHWCIAAVYNVQGDSCLSFQNSNGAFQKYGDAEKNYLIAIKYSEKEFNYSLPNLYYEIGWLYKKENKIVLAENYLNKSLKIAGQLNNKIALQMAYLYLSAIDSIKGDFEQAYVNYKNHIIYRDSLINEDSIRKSESYKTQYEVGKREDQIKLLSTENELKTALAFKQKEQKRIAYAGIAMILGIGGYGFYRYRRRKKLQSQQAVLSERLRISSELHDEVGATLSGIAMYSHLTKEQLKTGQTAEIEKSLNVMQQSSAQMVDKLNDIVWLINPEQDSLQKLIERLEEYAIEMGAIKSMRVNISVPEKIANINLPVESRRNIYLFCKEAINNAVKYSNATILGLIVKEVEGKLEFSVSDNGKGFDAVMVRRGNGLENMQKRADEIGAKLILQSKENEGASVSLQCKIT